MTHDLAKSPQDPELHCELGRLLLRTGQRDEGLRWLHSALRVSPRHRATHRALVDYYQRKGDKQRAEIHRKLAE